MLEWRSEMLGMFPMFYLQEFGALIEIAIKQNVSLALSTLVIADMHHSRTAQS